MGQEDTKKEMSFDCLRDIVEDAVRTKNICTIERIEDEHKLRYMQKYAELLVSKDESSISFKSCLIGVYGVLSALALVGFSLYSVSIPENQIVLLSVGYLIIAVLLFLWIKLRTEKKFENRIKDIEFIHEIILKIEERLPNRT